MLTHADNAGGSVKISRPSHGTVVAYVALFFAMSGTAVAATGGTFILGKSNAASTVSTLSNSTGTALSVTAPADKPALAVSNTVRVPRLNADLLDGVSSASFQRRVAATCPAHQAVRAISSSGTVTCSQAQSEVINLMTPGVYEITVPAGAKNVLAELWGGGGAGGPFGNEYFSYMHGAGGGEGGYIRLAAAVTPGEVLTVRVGAGGKPQADKTPGSAGGTTDLRRTGSSAVLGHAGGGGSGGNLYCDENDAGEPGLAIAGDGLMHLAKANGEPGQVSADCGDRPGRGGGEAGKVGQGGTGGSLAVPTGHSGKQGLASLHFSNH